MIVTVIFLDMVLKNNIIGEAIKIYLKDALKYEIHCSLFPDHLKAVKN